MFKYFFKALIIGVYYGASKIKSYQFTFVQYPLVIALKKSIYTVTFYFQDSKSW